MDCTKLMHALQNELGIPNNILYAMQNMYIEARIMIVHNHKLSDKILILVGMK